MEKIVEVKKQLGTHFKVKDMGELTYFLGVKVIQNKNREQFRLDKKHILSVNIKPKQSRQQLM